MFSLPGNSLTTLNWDENNLVNRQHPLAHGLIAAWLVTPGKINRNAGTPRTISWRDALNDIPIIGQISSGSGYGGTSNPWAASNIKFNPRASAMAWTPLLNDRTSGDLSFIITRFRYASGGESIFTDTAATSSFELNDPVASITFKWNNATIVTALGILPGTTHFAKWMMIGCTRWGTTGAWTGEIYIDGVKNNSGTTATNPGAPTAWFTTGCGVISDTDLLWVWNRRLYPSDHKWFYDLAVRGFPGLINRTKFSLGAIAGGVAATGGSDILSGGILKSGILRSKIIGV